MTSPSRLQAATMWLSAAVVFVGSWLYRFNDPNGSFGGLTDDHFFYLVRGWQILLGDLPVRDFVDHGAPLYYYVAAAVQLIGGRGTLSELVFSAGALSFSAALTFWLARRASGSIVLGLAAAGFQVLLEPRFYNYPKILVYALAIPVIWAFIDDQSTRRRFWMAAVTAVAFLFRHDHGVFVAIAAGLAIALLVRLPARERVKHAVVYVATVIALVSPYLVFIQLHGGVAHYFRQATTWAEQDRGRTPAVWPGLFDNPDGVSDAASRGGPVARPVAVLRDNWVAWMFYLEIVLPFVALAGVLVSRRGFRAPWPYAREKIAVVAALAFVLDVGFLRHPLAARLADPFVPHAVLVAWMVAACLVVLRRGREEVSPRLPGATRVAAGLFALATAVIVFVAVSALTYDLHRRLDKAGLVEGPRRAVRRTILVGSRLKQVWPLENWTSPDTPGVMRLAFYLRDCTGPSDRVFMQPYLPQVLALAQRGFAGGHADLRAGFFRTPEAEALTLERLRRQSVSVAVVAAEPEFSSFLEAYPRIAEHFDAHYRTAGEQALDGRFSVVLLVENSLVPTGTYAPLGWPCFR
ncbi:MAG: hypothetical protein AB1806_18330 [Acidobacteriota bacterium]